MSTAQPSITVFRGFAVTPAYTWSPFVNKLEARLRFGGLKYRNDVGSPPKAPRGKLPYVHVAVEGKPEETLSDTRFIVDTLSERGLLPDLNASLSPAEKALDLSVRTLLEDKAYYYAGYEKWVQNYYAMRDGVLGSIPYPVRLVVGLLAYRGQYQTLYGQGTARYTPEEIAMFRKEVWDGINGLVVDAKKAAPSQGDGDVFWLFKGSEPTEVDATLFGFITSTLVCTAAPDSRALIKTYPAVLDYAERIHERYFPEYDRW